MLYLYAVYDITYVVFKKPIKKINAIFFEWFYIKCFRKKLNLFIFKHIFELEWSFFSKQFSKKREFKISMLSV